MRGSIVERKRSKGLVYQARVSHFDPATGKRTQLSESFARKKDAEAWLARTIADIGRGTIVLPDTTTVRELFETYRATVLASSVRATTLYDYDLTIANHILPGLGSTKVQDLSTVTVQRWYASKLAEGTGARTLQVCHHLLRQALEAAVDWSIIPINPIVRAKAPAAPAKRFATWSPQQAAAFLAANEGQPMHACYVLALATGLRQGELLGLRWADVDLEAGTLSVRQQVVVDRGAKLGELKTPAARRSVALPAEAIAALRRQRTAMLEAKLRSGDWQEHDLVFATGRGTPWLPSNLSKRWQAALRRANVPAIRFHDMRHTHATWLLQAGVPVKVVSERLGHASVRITLDTYAHVLPDMQQAATAAIDRVFRTGS